MMRAASPASLVQWPLVGAVAVLCLLGIYNIHSSAASEDPHLFLSQLLYFVVGAVGVVLLLLPDYRVSESLAYPFYVVMCLLLVGVMAKGVSAGGARRWLLIGPLRFQPSEFAKLATVFCMARYLAVRIPPGGYSMRSLLRPLNPTRPLAVLAGIALAWNKPWLVDAPGELARLVHGKLGNTVIAAGDALWFRAFLVAAVVVLTLLLVLLVFAAERSQALLNPWPPGRRNRLLVSVSGVGVALLVLLAWWWGHPALQDPLAWALNGLSAAAGPGGRFAEAAPGYGVRLSILAAALIYLATSIAALGRHQGGLIDVVVAPIDLLLFPAGLIAMQPDLDNAVILVLTGLTMVFVVGVRVRSILLLCVLASGLAGVSWFGVLKDYQKRRILTFIDPEKDIKGAGWNAVQSMIAVGSGRVSGKGHMEGTQTQLSFLPEQHTDFAFSVWAEEQGFVGCLLLLGVYLLLLFIALSIAASAREPYGALLAAGVAAGFFWETIINIGMVIGVLPVVGMTLPFFSYGGSSLLAKLFGVGVLLNVHLRRRVS